MPNPNEIFRIAVRKFGPFESAMQKIWDQYCLFSGCKLKLELVIMDLHELHHRTLTDNGLANGYFDVAHINTDWLFEGYAADAFEILNPYIKNEPPHNYPQGWSNSLLALQEFDGKVVGLPFHDGPECLIYRKDLFENHEEQAAYQAKYGKLLMVPKTWEDFYNIAEFFNRPAQNLYGSIFACFPDGHNAVFDYCLQLWTRGGNLVDKNGTIQVDTPESLEGLNFYRQIVKDKSVTHPGSENFDSVAAGITFSQGEAAMMINWFGFAAMCEVDQHSKVKGKIYVDLLPANADQNSASLNVYWLYTIGKGSNNKTVAYDFLRFATNAANDKLLTLEGGIGCRISSWNDPQINRVIPFYHKLDTLHVVAKMLPQRKNWAQIAVIIDQMVLAAINTDNSSESILETAQKQINLIDK
jgi:multiple sugar transport system substrate-binding protein